MDRIKTFGIYALCVILFFIFSNVMIDIAIKATYMSIGADIISSKDLEIKLSDARATFVNGYVEGNVTNKGETVDEAFIEINLYSRRDVLLGTRYVRIKDFRQNETRDFRMGFECSEVESCEVRIIDTLPENVTEEQFTTKEFRFAKLLVTIIFITCFG